MLIRTARPDDLEAITAIYNQGIEERQATVITDPREPADLEEWLGADREPLLVAERDGGAVAGWARVGRYSDRCAYGGVGEYTIYVDRAARGSGVGRVLLEALVAKAEEDGYWKVIGRLFTTNAASIGLAHACGFDDVGVHRRHGRVEDEWRDVLVVERLLGPAAA